jgi:hypothetical protein
MGRRSNYNSTKVCFAYFGLSLRKPIDKAKASILDYQDPTEQSKPKTATKIVPSFGVAESD